MPASSTPQEGWGFPGKRFNDLKIPENDTGLYDDPEG
jgi:hypothetical protein